jgi:hypothetical protein
MNAQEPTLGTASRIDVKLPSGAKREGENGDALRVVEASFIVSVFGNGGRSIGVEDDRTRVKPD